MDELRLKPAERVRAPAWELGNDYDVMCEGKRVGRIRHHDPSGEDPEPWHWSISAEGMKQFYGNARSLDDAKADFRRAWARALNAE